MGLCHPVLFYTVANVSQGLWIWGTYVTCQWLIDMCDVTHSYVWDDLFICVIWRIHMRDMTHSCVWQERRCLGCDAWHDAFIWGTWLIRVSDKRDGVCAARHDSFICVTWFIGMCNMTHSYVWHDSLVCATWRIHMCDMTHSRVYQEKWGLGLEDAMCDVTHSYVCGMTRLYVWHDSFICLTWFSRVSIRRDDVQDGGGAMCDITHSYVWHDSFISVTCVIHMCDVTHSDVWRDSFVFLSGEMMGAVICDMTHSYVWHDSFVCLSGEMMGDCNVWHDSFICVAWLILVCDMTHSCVYQERWWGAVMCDMTHSYAWRDSFLCVTWLILVCDVTPPHVRHDSFICATWLIRVSIRRNDVRDEGVWKVQAALYYRLQSSRMVRIWIFTSYQHVLKFKCMCVCVCAISGVLHMYKQLCITYTKVVGWCVYEYIHHMNICM